MIDGGATHILLDLGGVNYMGSAGFRAIHAMTNMLNDDASSGLSKSPYLKLFNPTDAVARVIKTLGFDVYLDIYPYLKINFPTSTSTSTFLCFS